MAASQLLEFLAFVLLHNGFPTLMTDKKAFMCRKNNNYAHSLHRHGCGGAYLECVDDGLNVRFDSLVGELGAGQRAHALQGQVAQVGLPVLQELAQLVTGTHQQVGFTGWVCGGG